MKNINHQNHESSKQQFYRPLSRILFYSCFLSMLGTFIYYNYYSRKAASNYETWLSATLQQHNKKINDLMDSYLYDAQQLSKKDHIINAFEQLKTDNEKYAEQLKLFFEENSVLLNPRKNALLLDNDGRVIFSNISPAYINVKTVDNFESSSSLGQSFLRTFMTLTPDISNYMYDPILKRPALFICMPVFKEKKIIGVIALEVINDNIQNLMNDYVGFGKTGDLVFGNGNQDGIILINESLLRKSKPFKAFIPFASIHEKYPLMGYAAYGNIGSGIIAEDSKKIIAAWAYIPRVDWGVVGQRDLYEVYNHTFSFIIAWILLFLTGILGIFFIKYSYTLRYWLSEHFFYFLKKYGLATLFIIVAAIFAIKIYLFAIDMRKGLVGLKKETTRHVHDIAQSLNTYLNHVESIGKGLAHDLTNQHIAKDDLISRIERDLQQYQTIYGITVAFEPYQFDPKQRLYAPYVHRMENSSEFTIEALEKIYDYTNEANIIKNILDPNSWSWYAGALKTNGLIWFNPYPIDNYLLDGYSIPFYDKNNPEKALGVINLVFDCEKTVKDLTASVMGKYSYTMLFDATGTFIYHPRNEYVRQRATIFDLAEEQGNAELLADAKAMIAGKKGYYAFRNSKTGERNWIYSTNIPKVNWVLAGVFAADEANLSKESIRKHCIQLIIILMIFLVLLLIWFYGNSLVQLSRQMTILFIAGFLALLVLIQWTPTYNISSAPIPLFDLNHVNRFVSELDLYAQKTDEPIKMKIPTGVEIFSINFPTTTTMAVSGYVWQRYKKNIDRSLIQPVHFETVQMPEFKKLFELETDDELIIGWDFNIVVEQKFDYSKYPFDSTAVQISVEHPDLSKPILLIPSLQDYQNLRPQDLPGLYPGFNLSGFTISQSLFVFDYFDDTVTFGLPEYKSFAKTTYLAFEILLQRNLLYDFIVFFVPIMIIFFLLYSIFAIDMRKKLGELRTLTAYTGLIFVVTLLHRSLRERIVTSDILYIEYLFFMLYVIFGILALYTLLKDSMPKSVERIFEGYKIFFWPIQILTLFIITIIIFY